MSAGVKIKPEADLPLLAGTENAGCVRKVKKVRRRLTLKRRILRILSFGAGVQSTAMLLMACKGVLPLFDAVVFADTGWEPKPVYDHLEWCKAEALKAGMTVIVVKFRNLYEDAMKATWSGKPDAEQPWAAMPYYIKGADGKRSMIDRQCTKYYKILPIQKHIREVILGLESGQRVPEDVEIQQFMGISTDEARRMKFSLNKWQVSVYPLCRTAFYHPDIKPRPRNWGDLKKFYSRGDCVLWLAENYPGLEVPRSACKGCPFKSDAEWLAIKANPKDWEEVVALDRRIRKAGDGSNGKEAFLHRSCRPIEEVDFGRDKNGQLNWLEDGWDGDCGGNCGV
jgi:hypothetical protein